MFKRHLTAKWSLVSVLLFSLVACGGGGEPTSQNSSPELSKAAEVNLESYRKPSIVSDKTDQQNQYAPDRVIVRLENSTSASQQKLQSAKSSISIAGFEIVKEIDFSGDIGAGKKRTLNVQGGSDSPHLLVLKITQPGMTVEQAIEQLKSNPSVKYAEPDYKKSLHQKFGEERLQPGRQQTMAIPNDVYYSTIGGQWHHNNTGGSGGVQYADIFSQGAWDLTTGSTATTAPIIAVIDCGFKLDHPDLVGNWWVNPSPTYSDVNGADFGENDGNPTSTTCTHGTNVAGVIGARGNNIIGVAGVMWNSRIMALKTADATGALYVSAEIAAINYAIARKNAGQNVVAINISLGGYSYLNAEYDAVKAANSAGILVVASSGNDGTSSPSYPAGFDLPNVISVASTDRNDQLSSFSNAGRWVHIAAPGRDIYTTSFNTATGVANYEPKTGTSFSSPIVAGIAGLIANYLPSATMQQIRQRILSTGEVRQGLIGYMQIPKRVNAYYALTGATYSYAPPMIWRSNGGYGPADQYVRNASYIVQTQIGIGVSSTGVILTLDGTDFPLRDDGIFPDKFAGDGSYAGIVKRNAVGNLQAVFKHQYTNNLGASLTSSVTTTMTFGEAGNYQQTSVPYSWLEPVGAPGVQSVFATLADDNFATLGVPFPVSFYGTSGINTVTVSPNGLICLDKIDCPYKGSLSNAVPMPSNGIQANSLIAPWWNDFVVKGDATSNVFAHTIGSAPNRKFVITWKNAYPYFDQVRTDGVSFQLHMYEGQNKFTFSYLDTTTNIPNTATYKLDNGLVGSAGVQFFNGRIGTRTAYSQAGSILAGTSKDLVFGASFPDIANTDLDLYMSVEGIRGAYITVGCLGGTSYCGDDFVPRIQMAAFLSRSVFGHDLLVDYSYFPIANFPDVTDPKELNYVSAIKAVGITNGCLGGTQYCRDPVVNREAMALFLLRAVRGSTYVPPAGLGIFSDAPAGDSLSGTFEQLKLMGITNGCLGGTAYCRYDGVTRKQMAQFLQRAFRPWDYK
jgi:Subtilase family